MKNKPDANIAFNKGMTKEVMLILVNLYAFAELYWSLRIIEQ